MSNEQPPKKPAPVVPPVNLVGNQAIDIATLAAALREAFNPSINERVSLETKPEGRLVVRIPCVSPTGARFVACIEEGINARTGKREAIIRGLENYEYPWSPEMEQCANMHTPPLKWWKSGVLDDSGQQVSFAWHAKADDRVDHMTHRISRVALYELWIRTWQVDLREWDKLNLAQGAVTGLKSGDPLPTA